MSTFTFASSKPNVSTPADADRLIIGDESGGSYTTSFITMQNLYQNPLPIGAGTANTGAFTTLTTTGNATFGGNALTVNAAAPRLQLQQTDAGANEKNWAITNNQSDGTLSILTQSDAGTNGDFCINLRRTGTTVDEIEFNAADIDVNADVDVSGSLTVNGSDATIAGNAARLTLTQNDAGTDEKSWQLYNATTGTGSFSIFAMNDDGSYGNEAIAIDRTGSSIDKIELKATELDLNGVVTVDSLVYTDGGELTIASGAITVTSSRHAVDTEADASTDDLDTINGVATIGQRLLLLARSSSRTVVCKDGTGNLRLAGDFSLDNANDRIELEYDGVNWVEISRSDNQS